MTAEGYLGRKGHRINLYGKDTAMDQKDMIDDLVKMLDEGFENGTGHVNVDTSEDQTDVRDVTTMGCTDCSRTPLACSVPTLHQGIDDYQ